MVQGIVHCSNARDLHLGDTPASTCWCRAILMGMSTTSLETTFATPDAWLASKLLAPTGRYGRHDPLPGWSWRPRLLDYDLWLVRGGFGQAHIDGSPSVRLTPGTLLLLRPGDRGTMSQDEDAPVSVTFCHFHVLEPGSLNVRSIPMALAPRRFHWIDPEGPTAALLEMLVRTLQSRRPMTQLRSRALLGQMLADVYTVANRTAVSYPRTDEALVHRATAFINRDTSQRHTVAEVAAAVGVRPRLLAPLFREHLGMSVRDYLLEARLRRAQVLVGETDIPISTIARMLGYTDHTLMSKQFLTRFRLSPRAYRMS